MNLLDTPEPQTTEFAANRIWCPLCNSQEVEYEFVVDRLAFSRCRECALLFANPSHREKPPAALPADTPAIVQAALRCAARTTATELRNVVVVTDAAAEAVAGIPTLSPDLFFASTERYDAIVVAAAIERSGNPYALLAALGEKLTPGGRVVFLFPCLTSKDALTQRDRWQPFRDRASYLFSVDTMQSLATRCGFGNFLTFVDAQDLPQCDEAAARRWFGTNALVIAGAVVPPQERVLSVIFPVYNERATVVESLQRVLDKEIPGVRMEIVIVESNSTDGSREIVQGYADHPKVTIVYEDRPRGKGHAVRTGLAHASGQVVLFQDADLEYDVEDYEALVTPLFERKRNFVLGSRHNARGTAWKIRHFDDQPGLSNVANLAHVALLALFNGVHKQSLLDPFTMYKVFRRDCLYGLTFEDDRFDFDHEINIKLIRKGYRPIELPVNYNSRSFKEGKKIAIFRDPPTWVRSIVRHRTTRLYEFLLGSETPPFGV